MKVALVYASFHHGNTRRVAEAMAGPLNATMLTVDEALTQELQPYDLIGFGSGIYFGRNHATLLDLAQKLESIPRRCFIFSTAGLSSLSGLWHRRLKQQLQQRGSQVVGEFCCPGWDTVGPLWLFGGLHRHRPNEHDLARAGEFAKGLRATLEPAPTAHA